MIPIRDTVPAQRTAWVVRALVLANVALFIVEVAKGQAVEAFIYRFGIVPAQWVFNGLGDWLAWPSAGLTLLTSQFLHGDILHLGSNMLYLWIFGDNVEDRLGHGRFLLMYLASGIAAGAAQIVASPHSSMPMIGASGAIAGILGAYFLLFPYARIVTLVPMILTWEFIEVPAFAFLGFWFLLQWLQGLTTIGQLAETGGVAWWAHVGGFVWGLIFVVWARFVPRSR